MAGFSDSVDVLDSLILQQKSILLDKTDIDKACHRMVKVGIISYHGMSGDSHL